MNQRNYKIREVFIAAAALATPEGRACYLDGACGDDADLRQRVEALLQAYDPQDGFLEGHHRGSDCPQESPGTVIGRYKLLEEIGEGTFGRVFMAEQLEPVHRKVALKVLKAGMDTLEVIARFEVERQALALMDHPNIAKVFDAGTTETGRPYFVMELVRGLPFTRYCDEHDLPMGERLRLFTEVCHAVQHAHQKAVIHRDLKPSNILVTEVDGEPVPKVIDFGVAKALGQQLTEKTLFTAFQQMIGTPVYMSPEQTAISGADVDTRSDVYSLGVLLYELLTGVTPLDTVTLQQAGLDEMRRIIRESEPPKPSTRLRKLGNALPDVARHRHVQPSALTRLVHGDLDWIVMKALEKDRARRYQTITALAEDIERHLASEPVSAGPPDTLYRSRKFVRRHRHAVTAATAVLIALVAGVIVSTAMYFEAEVARDEALRRATIAGHHVRIMRARSMAETNPEAALLILREIPEDADRNTATWALNVTHEVLQISPCVTEWLLMGHNKSVVKAEWSPDGKRIATASSDRTARIWSLDHKNEAIVLTGHADRVRCAAWSPDGRSILTASHDSTARVWSADGTLEPIVLAGHTDKLWSASWSPDGRRILTTSSDKTARVWNADGSVEPIVLRGHTGGLTGGAWSPDGRRIATKSWDRTVRVWNADGSGTPVVLAGHKLPVRHIAWSPDGRLILTVGDYTPCVWNVDDTRGVTGWHDNPAQARRSADTLEPIMFSGHTNVANFAAWSPDGEQIVTTSDDHTARVWSADGTGDPIILAGHGGWVGHAAWSPDGKRIVTTSIDRTARVWNADGVGEPVVLMGHKNGLNHAAWSPDGQRIVTTAIDNMARVWNLGTESEPIVLGQHTGAVFDVEWSSDGKRIATASGDGTARVWRVDGFGEPVVLAGHSARVIRAAAGSPDGRRVVPGHGIRTAAKIGRLAWSPDGRRVVTASADGMVRVWNAGGADPPVVLAGHKPMIIFASWSPDGKRIATGSTEGMVRLWNADGSGKPIILVGKPGNYPCAAWSPDGKRIATNAHDSSPRVWNADGSGEATVLCGQTETINHIAWSPDGRRIIMTAYEGTVRILNSDGSGEPTVLAGHGGRVRQAAWSPDGRHVCTVSEDRTARVWNAKGTGKPIVLIGHTLPITHVAWSPDGKRVFTSSLDGTVRCWDLNQPERAIVFPWHANNPVAMNYLALSPDGKRLAIGSKDGKVLLWTVRSWPEMRARLWERMRYKFTPEERMQFLDETADEARSVSVN